MSITTHIRGPPALQVPSTYLFPICYWIWYLFGEIGGVGHYEYCCSPRGGTGGSEKLDDLLKVTQLKESRVETLA